MTSSDIYVKKPKKNLFDSIMSTDLMRALSGTIVGWEDVQDSDIPNWVRRQMRPGIDKELRGETYKYKIMWFRKDNGSGRWIFSVKRKIN
jgi:hypothetical protein